MQPIQIGKLVADSNREAAEQWICECLSRLESLLVWAIQQQTSTFSMLHKIAMEDHVASVRSQHPSTSSCKDVIVWAHDKGAAFMRQWVYRIYQLVDRHNREYLPGLSTNPADDACHIQFIERANAWLSHVQLNSGPYRPFTWPLSRRGKLIVNSTSLAQTSSIVDQRSHRILKQNSDGLMYDAKEELTEKIAHRRRFMKRVRGLEKQRIFVIGTKQRHGINLDIEANQHLDTLEALMLRIVRDKLIDDLQSLQSVCEHIRYLRLRSAGKISRAHCSQLEEYAYEIAKLLEKHHANVVVELNIWHNQLEDAIVEQTKQALEIRYMY